MKNSQWDGEPITLEQNGDRIHPNRVNLITRKAAQGNVRVLFGGGAIVRIQGEYIVS